MKLKDVLKGIQVISSTAVLDMDITGISCNSRTVKPGDLFVAVRGYTSDGHKYIPPAVERGAVCVLCEEKPEWDVPYVITDNSRRALAAASVNFYGDPSSKIKIIGVTGTNGKTTVTTLIKSMIEHVFGAKVGLIGTITNMIGDISIETERTTPESCDLQQLLSRMAEAGCQYVVMEVSSHALFLDRVYGVTFEEGIFTNLTEDHLDFHKTMEKYAEAKSILFGMCKKAIINTDDEYSRLMLDAAKCPVDTFAVKDQDGDFRAENVALNPAGVVFDAVAPGGRAHIELGIPGMFSVYNGLTAIAAMYNLGVGLEEAAEALSACVGVKGRAEIVPTGRDFTVLIDYAHTPDALENILNTVNCFKKGRLVLLFGCGGDREHEKRPNMGAIACKNADFVIVTSDNPRTEEPESIIRDILGGMEGTHTPYTVISDRREAIKYAITHARPDDVVVLAGKGHETYQVFGKEKIHFDEREVVAEVLKGLN